MSVGSGALSASHEDIDGRGARDWQNHIETFVGREREMQILRTRIDDATNGRGSLVLVSGEPGIGKTRLLTEASRYAESKEMQVLWGRCWEGEGAPAFWPWIQTIRGCLTSLGTTARDNLIARTGQPILTRLTTCTPPTDTRISSIAQFQLFDSISEVLRLTAEACPLVLFLDDLHQADSSSTRVLEFVLSDLRQSNFTIVATARTLDGPQHPSPTLSRVISAPGTSALQLLGLNDQAARQLISDQLGSTDITEPAVRTIQARTEGNPFFLIEICHTLRTLPELNLPAVLGVPESARLIVDKRMCGFPQMTRHVLAVAAVIGRTFSADLLGETNDVLPHLLIARQDGLILPTGTRPNEYQFSHALVREAIYSSLTPETRSSSHAQIANEIERSNEGHADELADPLAHHYFYAGTQAPRGKALEFTVKAAANARSSAAYDYAAELLRRGLALARGDSVLGLDLQLELGSALLSAGRWQESRETFLEAASGARRIGSGSRLAKAAIGAKGLILSPAPPDQRSIDLLQEALNELPAEETHLRVQVLHALATATHFSPPQSSNANLATEALCLAETLNNTDAIATALEAVIITNWRPGTARRMIEYATRLLDLGQDSRDIELQGRARIHLYVARSQHAEATAETEIDFAERVALESNHPKLRWQVNLLRSSQALVRGDFDTGLDYAHTARELGNKCHDQTAFLHLGLNLLLRARLRGSFDGLDSSIRDGAKLTPDVPLSKLAIACVDFASDPAAHRPRALQETIDACLSYLQSNAFSLWGQCLLAELSFLSDNKEAAARVLTVLEPYADEAVVAGWGTALEGSAAHFVGLANLTLRKTDKAVACLSHAIRTNSECNWTLLRARSQLFLALAADRQQPHGDGSMIDRHAAAAVRTYDQAGLDIFDNPFIVGADGSSLYRSFEELFPRSASQTSTPPPSATLTATQEGDFVLFVYQSSSVRLRATKGARQLVWIVTNPGHEIPATLLAQIDHPDRDLRAPGAGRSAKSKVIDDQARQEYTIRVREIRALLDSATDDPAATLEVREELEWLTSVLSASRNIHGETRHLGDPDERARVAVRNNLSNVIRRIFRQDERLGTHLTNSVHTGTSCSYRPE